MLLMYNECKSNPFKSFSFGIRLKFQFKSTFEFCGRCVFYYPLRFQNRDSAIYTISVFILFSSSITFICGVKPKPSWLTVAVWREPKLYGCCHEFTVRLRMCQIVASLSKDYGNKVRGHWPGNVAQNADKMKFDSVSDTALLYQSERQTGRWVDFFPSLGLLLLVFRPLIFQTSECLECQHLCPDWLERAGRTLRPKRSQVDYFTGRRGKSSCRPP